MNLIDLIEKEVNEVYSLTSKHGKIARPIDYTATYIAKINIIMTSLYTGIVREAQNVVVGREFNVAPYKAIANIALEKILSLQKEVKSYAHYELYENRDEERLMLELLNYKVIPSEEISKYSKKIDLHLSKIANKKSIKEDFDAIITRLGKESRVIHNVEFSKNIRDTKIVNMGSSAKIPEYQREILEKITKYLDPMKEVFKSLYDMRVEEINEN